MKWRNSRVIRGVSIGLLTALLCAACTGGCFLCWLYTQREIQAGSYEDTLRCQNAMREDAGKVFQYTQLLDKRAIQPLKLMERAALALLEKQKVMGESSNFLWKQVDSHGAVVRTNATEKELSLFLSSDNASKQSGNIYRLPSDTRLTNMPSTMLYYTFHPKFPYMDSYRQESVYFTSLQQLSPWLVYGSGLALLLALALLPVCACCTGSRSASRKNRLYWLDRCWLELLFVLLALFIVLLFFTLPFEDLVLIALLGIGIGLLFTVTLLSVLRRIQQHRLLQTTLLYSLGCYLSRFIILLFRHLRLTFLTLAVVSSYMILQLLTHFGMYHSSVLAAILWLFLNVGVLVLIVCVLTQYRQLREAVARLAKGNLGPVIEEKTVPVFRSMAADINHTIMAIQQAVEQTTRSERMKTELIANVSHDIKNPLTTIISYVQLLRTTGITDARALEYLNILDHKSEYLGRLVADLVEASKASSGNMEVHCESLNGSELLAQAEGESETRLEARRIQVKNHLPEEAVYVQADGYLMGRVLDNLFSNAAKYALPGTWMYAELEKRGDEAVLSLTNVSETPVDIPVNELTERFVRGDHARHTEGNGLGLSIASSLMELQHGRLDIQLDGDLFKVTLTLPLA